MKPMPSLRACGARPSAGGGAGHGSPSGVGDVDDPNGGCGGGTRSARPHGTAGRMARHCFVIGGFTRSWWPKRGNIWLWRCASFAGVQSPPLRGMNAPRRNGLAGKGPGIGDFLGGTRSPRPRIRGGRKPGHSIPTGWLTMSRWPREHMPRSSPRLP